MSTYSFKQVNERGVVTIVEYDDVEDATAEAVVGAFVQFLKGVTFEGASIRKYINHELA